MPVLRNTDSPVFEAGQSRIVSLAAPSRGAAETTVFRAVLGPGATTSLQFHDHEEIVTVLSGSGRMRIGEDEIVLSQGDTAVVPARALHEAATIGDEPWDCVILAPASTLYFNPDGTEAPAPPSTR